MTTRKYRSFSDPGHGWLRVPHTDLDALGISDQISTYSYQNGDWVYLEEDCDLTLFMKTADKAGWTVAMTHTTSNNPSSIRNFHHYQKPRRPFIGQQPLTLD